MFEKEKVVCYFKKGKKYMLENMKIRKEGKYVNLYIREKRKSFVYNIELAKIDETIYFSYKDVYKSEDFNHEKREKLSEIVVYLKKMIKEISKERMRVIVGGVKLNLGWVIIEDIKKYKDRLEKINYKKDLTYINKSINEIKKKKSKINNNYSYKLFISGKDGIEFSKLLEKESMINIEEERKIDVEIKLNDIEDNYKEYLVDSFVEEMKFLGYQVNYFKIN